MRRIRVIPTLLLNSSGGLVKTIKFGKRTYIGDPINAVKIFNEKGVDELILLDIDATRDGREPNYGLIEDIASEAFMPIAYGGGITSIDQMSKLFRVGFEKVVVSTAAIADLQLIRTASEQFGSQSIVVCANTKYDWRRRLKIVDSCITARAKNDWISFLTEVVRNGAGEIILYSVDKDGTMTGMDLSSISMASAAISVPLVAMGGAGSIKDFQQAIANGASAVSAGSLFVLRPPHKAVLITYPTEAEIISVTIGVEK